MYSVHASDHIPEIGSHRGFQIESFHQQNGTQILITHVEEIRNPIAKLSSKAICTSVLSSVGGDWLAISDALMMDIKDSLDAEDMSSVALTVIDKGNTNRSYHWCAIDKLDVEEYVVPQNSLVARKRFNQVGYPEISYPHIPMGAIELLPEPIEAAVNYKGAVPEGGWSRVLRWLAMEIKPGKRTPPLFWMPFGIFCTDEFFKMYQAKGHTGLQFRKLEATPSQWKGEKTIINYPSYFT